MINDNSRAPGRVFLIILATLTPFILAALLVAVSGHSIFDVAPYYVGGDAVARYDYVRNIIEHGTLLGYNGYDFVTAKIPSLGSAWGFFWAIPYIAFGKLFGWGFNAPVMANLLFLCAANLLFILLTKADKRSIICVIAASCLLFINVNYSISAMSEPSRYALVIILCGMFYRLMSFDTSPVYKYLIVPLTIIFASSTFILLSAFIIPYFLIILKDRNALLKWSVSLAVFAVGALGIKKINSRFCTPYFEVFNMKKDAMAFQEGLANGVHTVIRTSLHNLKQFTLGAVTNMDYQSGKYTWFVFVCWIMMIALAAMLLAKRYQSEKDKYLMLGALYLLVIITAGYIVLYNDVIATLIRGINTGLCAAVFLLTLMDSKKIAAFYMVLALLWSPFFVKTFLEMCDEDYRCLSDAQIEEIEARRAVAAEYIILDPDADPWDNTVAICHGGKTTAFVVPSGAGKISMHEVRLNEKARYVLIGNNGDKNDIDGMINAHLANGHELLVQTDDFTILKRVG